MAIRGSPGEASLPDVLYRNLGDILKCAGRVDEAHAAYTRAANTGAIAR